MILGQVYMDNYVELYSKENEKSKHFDVRKDRLELVIQEARPLFFFEVIKQGKRQVHVLYEDASLYIYNKESGLVITVILPSRKVLLKYFTAANDYPSEYPSTQRCAKIHEKFIKKGRELNHYQIKELRKKKQIHLGSKFKGAH